MNEGPSGFGGPAGFGGPDSAATESETRAELQAEFESIPRGRPFYLYYTLETAPGWYAYYLNNTLGFTIRPSLQLDAIAGVELGELEFPLPQEKDTFGVPSLVFQGQTYFRLPVTVTADYVGTELTFTGTASWQICKESCLPPEDRAVSLTLAVTDAAPAPNTSLPADLKTRFSSRSLTSGAATLGPDGISLELSQPVSAPRFLDLDGQTAFGIAPGEGVSPPRAPPGYLWTDERHRVAER